MKGIIGFVLVCLIVISLHVYSDNNTVSNNDTAKQTTSNNTINNNNISDDSSNKSSKDTTTEDTNSDIETGQRIVLKRDTPVCSSKENVDKMIAYLRNKNNKGISGMEQRGEAMILNSETEVNVVKMGIVTEIETDTGERWFAPSEVFK